jgi:hypothetical protein
MIQVKVRKINANSIRFLGASSTKKCISIYQKILTNILHVHVDNLCVVLQFHEKSIFFGLFKEQNMSHKKIIFFTQVKRQINFSLEGLCAHLACEDVHMNFSFGIF